MTEKSKTCINESLDWILKKNVVDVYQSMKAISRVVGKTLIFLISA
jgi:hypothetical protein